MGRYTGPKVRLSRRCGVPIADIPKHTGKELTLPGMHGYRGRRSTEYGIRLTEKQKLRHHYGVLEKQFRRYLDAAKRSKGNTANSLMQLLELRLDNVCRRIGVGRTIWATRQIVAHGHVLLNGRRIDLPSAQVSAGDEIALAPSLKENGHVKASFETARGRGVVPEWLTVDTGMMAARVAREPARNDISYPITEQLIVELYSK